MEGKNTYDVIICGGGLAGLSLARQLKLTASEISILLLDKIGRPLPKAAFKVGESTVSVGAHYLADNLKLTDYFRKAQLKKLELRFFFGDPSMNFEDRPEFGVTEFLPPNSYQIDRGIFESDLREFVIGDGVIVREGVSVSAIEISAVHGLHEVTYRADGSDQLQTAKCRWVIDAMGRRRYLQKKLGHTKPLNGPKHGAAWFRLEGRIDVADLVPADKRHWHERVANSNRYYSTNHLVGDGYWVWLIALPSESTSIGIVTDEALHPFFEYNTYERAVSWLRIHEPLLANRIANCKPMDFLKLRDYSYTSHRVFSFDRWACTGEAGVFSDPLYSPGTDVIGFANSCVVKLICTDLRGKLTTELVDDLNSFLLAYNDGLTYNIQAGYSYFGRDVVMASKLIWDFVAGWGLAGPMMFNRYYLEPAITTKVRKITGRFVPLSLRVQKLLLDWSKKTNRKNTFEFIDYLRIPFVREIRARNLQSNKKPDEIVSDHILNMAIFEELAQAIFLLAVEDLYPEVFARFTETIRLNAWAIDLDQKQWNQNGLFSPKSGGSRSQNVRKEFRDLFKIDGRSLPGSMA